jgi:hypothetical protein
LSLLSSCGCVRGHPLCVAPKPLGESEICAEGSASVLVFMSWSMRLLRASPSSCLKWVRASAPVGGAPEPLGELEIHAEGQLAYPGGTL